MALNPFFLQGSPNEQRLIQELINEQLKIYGVEVTYIPRKFVRKETILKEISSSKFDDNFSIEAYVNNYEGYSGQGDILTKFGVNLKDELELIISRETYEDFIAPFLSEDDPEIEINSRPREGDLIYFPLGQRIFEVKFVENEQPFYQLGKLYIYQLKCELFEYEDEIIDTTIEEIDTQVKDSGYIVSLNMSTTVGENAEFTSTLTTGGYVRRVYLNNDGYGYTSTPTVTISGGGGSGAEAIAIMQPSGSTGRYKAVKEILLLSSGSGYQTTPTVTISGGGGSGAAATCLLETQSSGILSVITESEGSGYIKPPTVGFGITPSEGEIAVGIASVSTDGKVKAILLSDAGFNYTSTPIITISPPESLSGSGNYQFNEIIVGSISSTTARVKSWNATTKVLKVSFIDNVTTKGFYSGELIVGQASSATYTLGSFESFDNIDKYSENLQIENEADSFVDFSESNPFGTF